MRRRARWTGVLAALVALLFAGRRVAELVTERWWAAQFSPDAAAFVTERLLLELVLWLAAVLVAASWFIGHLFAVHRALSAVQVPRSIADIEVQESVAPRSLLLGAVGLGAVLGLAVGAGAGARWPVVALAWHGLRYGIHEPLLGRDVGFYVAQLPLWRTLHAYGLVLVLVALAMVVALYVVVGAIRWIDGRPAINGHARTHVGWLLASLALVLAWGYFLEPYELVAGRAGAVDRGGFRIVALTAPALAGTALAVAAISAVWATRARHTLLVAGWLVLGLASLVGHIVLPPLLSTAGTPAVPAEDLERLGRAAYDLDSLVVEPYAGHAGDSSVPALAALWSPASAALAAGVDTASETPPTVAPVVLTAGAARRPAWLVVAEERDGPVATLVADDRVSPAGRPAFYVATDTIPHRRPTPAVGLRRTASRPGAPRYLLLDTPADGAGLPVGGWLRRLPLAWTLQIGRLVGPVPGGARLAWRLDPVERVGALAPFAEWREPTPVLVDGVLLWLVHGYFTPEHFPLAPRTRWDERTVGSVRPGLLGVVDAASGEASIYLRTPEDPLADAWTEIAGGVVQPAEAIPARIRAAVPYPRALFLAQRQALLAGLGRVPVGSSVPLGETGIAAVWSRDTAATVLQAAFVREATGDVSAVLGGAMRAGREAPRLTLVDSTASVPTPSGLDDTWRRFPIAMQLAESVSAVKGEVIEGPIRLSLGGPSLAAYQPTYAVGADGRVALIAVNVAAGSRVGAGRDMPDAWANLRGLRAPTPPTGRRAPADPLETARRLLLEADSAARAGDWVRFGRAYEALREALLGDAAATGARR